MQMDKVLLVACIFSPLLLSFNGEKDVLMANFMTATEFRRVRAGGGDDGKFARRAGRSGLAVAALWLAGCGPAAPPPVSQAPAAAGTTAAVCFPLMVGLLVAPRAHPGRCAP